MKGYIQNQTIILQDSLPDTLQNGAEVEIFIIPIKKRKYPSSVTFRNKQAVNTANYAEE